MPIMDPAHLEERTRKLDRCVRRRNTFEYLGCAAIAVIFGLQALGAFDGPGAPTSEVLMRSGAALVALAALFIAFEIRRRTAPVRGSAGPDDRLAACIARLDRQRRALKSAWLWYAAPLLPGFLLIYAGQVAKPDVGVLGPLVAAGVTLGVFAWIAFVNRRAARGLDDEIGKLEAVARQES